VAEAQQVLVEADQNAKTKKAAFQALDAPDRDRSMPPGSPVDPFADPFALDGDGGAGGAAAGDGSLLVVDADMVDGATTQVRPSLEGLGSSRHK
jgi:hypothetical protein